MSYARFSDGDVYVFTSSHGIECCGCFLVPRHWVDDPGMTPFGGYLAADTPGEEDPCYRSNAEMIAHLERHRAAGHEVPEYAFERLRDPADEAANQQIWAEDDKERREKTQATDATAPPQRPLP